MPETGWHRHAHDYVVVCLTPGKLLAETKDGNFETPLHAGQAYARPVGVEHNIVNTSQGEFAGLGKSRLLEETRRLALARGVRWLQGDCVSFGRTLSYWSFREIIRRGFGIDERDDETASWLKVQAGMHELFGEQSDEVHAAERADGLRSPLGSAQSRRSSQHDRSMRAYGAMPPRPSG